ncbi:hypothetical protein C0J52_25666 [Blattella germanica]|nr:hypothetical protein C0J52_25666 [Blattella germanica]
MLAYNKLISLCILQISEQNSSASFSAWDCKVILQISEQNSSVSFSAWDYKVRGQQSASHEDSHRVVTATWFSKL